ncbi:MAG: pyridoxal phosphate-dependent aminotransferase [Solirubrobacterales bacterium]
MSLKYKKSLIEYNAVSYVSEDTEIISEDKSDIVDCALGTNPYGHTTLLDSISPEIFKNINLYPDYPYVELKRDLVDYWSTAAALNIKNIHISNGSIAILENINRLFIEPGTRVLGICPQFTDYSCDIKAMGGIFDYVLLKESSNYRFNINDVLNAIKPEHTVVYIDNPNNPTGQVISIDDIRLLLEKTEPLHICVIIDEAYADFISKEESAISLVNEFNNLIVTRSFSKGLGLAGMRIGYLISNEELCSYYVKANSPFSISNISAHMAQVALRDYDFIKESSEKIKTAKSAFIKSLTKLKVGETDIRVPIMLLICEDKEVDLYNIFYKNKIATERGADFTGLSKNSIRFKIPKDSEKVMKIVNEIEKKLK